MDYNEILDSAEGPSEYGECSRCRSTSPSTLTVVSGGAYCADCFGLMFKHAKEVAAGLREPAVAGSPAPRRVRGPKWDALSECGNKRIGFGVCKQWCGDC